MLSQTVVVLHSDPTALNHLANALRSGFRDVRTVRSVQELLTVSSQLPIDLVIVDLTAAKTADIKYICSVLRLPVVCTHHLANEHMWAEVVGVGALDCCYDDDAPGIWYAIQKHGIAARGGSAA